MARIKPRSLTLIVTHRCVAACAHCCFGCSPRNGDRIPPARLSALIDEAREVPSIERITFTGGEPFLLGPELIALTARAAGHGFRVTAMTSGAWAKDATTAQARLAPLAAAGLREISLSTGANHERFVPVERVIDAALSAVQLGIVVSVSVEVFAGSTFDRRAILEHDRLGSLIDRGRVRFFERPWIGHADEPRETAPTHASRYSRFEPTRISHCPFALDELTVMPKLALAACCGHPIESIPALAIGSVANMTLREVLETAHDAPLHEMLRTYGPERMYRLAAEMHPSVELPVESAHACQTCTLLHRDDAALSSLKTFARSARKHIADAFDAAVAAGY